MIRQKMEVIELKGSEKTVSEEYTVITIDDADSL